MLRSLFYRSLIMSVVTGDSLTQANLLRSSSRWCLYFDSHPTTNIVTLNFQYNLDLMATIGTISNIIFDVGEITTAISGVSGN